MTPETQNEHPPTSDPAVGFSKLLAAVEQAWREGYDEGYGHGSSDNATYECGGGSPHPKTLKRRKDESWEWSDAKAANAPHEPRGAKTHD